MPYVVRLSPEGFSKKQEKQNNIKEDGDVEAREVKGSAKRSAWAGHNPSDYCSPMHPRQDL